MNNRYRLSTLDVCLLIDCINLHEINRITYFYCSLSPKYRRSLIMSRSLGTRQAINNMGNENV